MKKIRITTIILALMLLLLPLLLVACKEEGIKAPSGYLFDRDTQTLKWSKINGAYSYEVRVDGDDMTIQNTKANYVSLEYLDAGEHLVEVRAYPRDTEAEPSEWSSHTIVRDKENGLKYRLINNRTEYEVIGGGTAFGDVVMEPDYRGKPVVAIADKAFSGNKKITSLVVGDKVRTIGKNAFTKCSELTSITLSESLESIGEYAFQSCKMLTSIVIPEGVTEIQPYTFSWCSSLATLEIKGNLTAIGEYAFSNCESMVTAALPDTLVSVGEYAFSDCALLKAIDLGDSIETIGAFAFSNCKSWVIPCFPSVRPHS